jgi:DnaA family protein
MSQMKQLALDISMAPGPTLARFFVGPNAALIDHLRHWVGDGQLQQSRTPVPTYLWGEAGSGKSHLLKAVREALREQGAMVGWMDASTPFPPEFDERWAAVLMDDVDIYTPFQQARAFNWFVNATSPPPACRAGCWLRASCRWPISRCARTCAPALAGVMSISCICSTSRHGVPCCVRKPMPVACF